MNHYYIILGLLLGYVILSYLLNLTKPIRGNHWVMVLPAFFFTIIYCLSKYYYHDLLETPYLDKIKMYFEPDRLIALVILIIQLTCYLAFKLIFLRVVPKFIKLVPYHYTKNSKTNLNYRLNKFEIIKLALLIAIILSSLSFLVILLLDFSFLNLEGICLLSIVCIEIYWYINGVNEKKKTIKVIVNDELSDKFKNVEKFDQYYSKIMSENRAFKIIRMDKVLNVESNGKSSK
jgi:hypothetical protein